MYFKMEENQWFHFGGNRVLQLLVLGKNTGSLKIANKILQVFYTGATTVLAYSDFKEQHTLQL